MDKQEREDWEAMCEEEKAKRLLIKYELETDHYRHARNWLIFICIVLVITCGILFQKWQEQRYFAIFSEALAGSYEQDSEHYQELYYDTLGKYHDCQNQNEFYSPWRS